MLLFVQLLQDADVSEYDKNCSVVVEEIAKRLKEIREEKGISKNELSQLSGVSRASIRRIEEGERSPSVHLLLLITKAMEVELGQIISKANSLQ